jgi:RNA polymerase sigma-70 factor (ECF subfamily)
LLAASWNYLFKIALAELPQALQARLGAEDLVQQTLLEAYLSLPSFTRRPRKDWFAWIRTILCHNLQNANRDGHRQMRSVAHEVRFRGGGVRLGLLEGFSVATETPEEPLERQEGLAGVRKVVSELPEPLRRVVWLRTWNGRTCADVGRRLGLTESAVQKLYRQALQRMRGRLAHFE